LKKGRFAASKSWALALALVAASVAAASRSFAAPASLLSPPPLSPTPPAPPPMPAPPPLAGGEAPAVPAPPAVDAPSPGPVGPLERLVPTMDATAIASDHDAVRDSWGVTVRPVTTKLPVFGLRAMTGCPTAVSTASATGACPPVTVSELAGRRWVGRNVALDAGLAFALGGGSEAGRLLDTYFGLGPTVGASILLANWRHVAIAAGPALTVVIFKGAGSASTTYVADLLGSLEAELHLGFIGAPALSLGIRSGLAFRLEHAVDATVWSVGVGGATTVRSLFEDVALRYYF
jgi:hypothetical protein